MWNRLQEWETDHWIQESIRDSEREAKASRDPEQGKVLRVLPSGRWLPRNLMDQQSAIVSWNRMPISASFLFQSWWWVLGRTVGWLPSFTRRNCRDGRVARLSRFISYGSVWRHWSCLPRSRRAKVGKQSLNPGHTKRAKRGGGYIYIYIYTCIHP